MASRAFVVGTVIMLFTSEATILAGASLVAQKYLDGRLNQIRYIQIPSDLSRREVVTADEVLKERLHFFSSEQLRLDGITSLIEPAADVIVVFTDEAGVPILPDREAAQHQLGKRAKASMPTCSTNELVFSFNSSASPWSTNEQATLSAWLQDFYPVAKSVWGNPFFNITINLRKDTNSTVSGYYNPSLNELVLRGTNSSTLVCHEMLHAFADDIVLPQKSFTEGMTRAAEVEVFDRLPAYVHWDENHSYTYDIYYEGLNWSVIGWGLSDDYVGELMRYQLAGYAWAKCLIENPDFLRLFNCKLYASSLADSATQWTESKLLSIAASVQATVEGRDFLSWYHEQGVFHTDPPQGYFLFQRSNQSTIDYFLRDSSGAEIMQPNAVIHWTVFDYRNEVLLSGSKVTTAFGWLNGTLSAMPATYSGRIKVVAWAASPVGTVTNAALTVFGVTTGVFGVVANFDAGTVAITALDGQTTPVVVNVINGAFTAPSLGKVKGRFLAEFKSPTGETFSKQFTKDASDYYLELRPPMLSVASGSYTALPIFFTGERGRKYLIEGTTNWSAWEPLTTLTNEIGEAQFTATNVIDSKARFYRAKALP